MRKTSFYLLLIILVGLGVVSFWVYKNYFKKEIPKILLFQVQRGSLQELVKVRGEAAAQKEVELEFPFSGIVDEIFVKEGEKLEKGETLARLEKKELELEKNELEAVLGQSRAGLEKLLKGAMLEEIAVSQTKVSNAQKALQDQQVNFANVSQKAQTDLANVYSNVKNVLYDSFTKADDAVNKQTDDMFTEDFSSSPQIAFNTLLQLEVDSENQRLTAGKILATFKSELDKLSSDYDALDKELTQAKDRLALIRDFLLKLTDAVNSAAGLSSTLSTSYKTSLNTARNQINTALSSIDSQQQSIASQKITNKNNTSSTQTKVNEAQAALDLAQSELSLLKAPARQEDIKIAEAKIQEIKSRMDTINDKIEKSTLSAPFSGVVKKIHLEEKEVFQPGKSAISLSAEGFKIQADVSELEIGKIKDVDGNSTLIRLDAFPGKELKGKVIFIEPEEIIKEGDKFYRLNVEISDSGGLELRSGMSADLIIITLAKDEVLKIPEFTTYKKDGKIFVRVLEQNQQKEVEIETGISDGEYVEAVKGLVEGQTIVVSAD